MKSSIIICNNYTNFCFIKKLKRSMKLDHQIQQTCVEFHIVEEGRVQTEFVATLYEDKMDTGKVVLIPPRTLCCQLRRWADALAGNFLACTMYPTLARCLALPAELQGTAILSMRRVLCFASQQSTF
jgi:xanthine dehydrogenase iron-sulfur cluster and FAD-binding subunit A